MLDMTNLIDAACYRNALFGRFGGAWQFDAWSMQLLREQIDRGEVAEYTMRRLTEAIPISVVAKCIATPTPLGRHCDGYGNVHLGHDSDYECGGCFGCRPERAAIGWSIGAFV